MITALFTRSVPTDRTYHRRKRPERVKSLDAPCVPRAPLTLRRVLARTQPGTIHASAGIPGDGRPGLRAAGVTGRCETAGVTSRLTVLGSCGAWPGRACSGFVLEHRGARLVLDLGYGTLPRLLALLGSSAADGIDAVITTHAHPDHMIEILLASEDFEVPLG